MKPASMVNHAAIGHNVRIITYCRSTLAAVAGAAAGILGLQGLSGFFFYFIASAIMSAGLYVWTNFKPGKYFPGMGAPSGPTGASSGEWMALVNVLTFEVFGSLFSYLLFWTLVYGLVHIYD
jgi:hypothetical protein